MSSFLRSLLGLEPSAPAAAEPSDRRLVAAAALLIEAAGLDGRADDAERARISMLMRQRFALSPAVVDALVEEAEAEAGASIGLHSFTSVIKEGFDQTGRLELMEMLWQVILSDGEVHDYEASLMRRVAGLLYVADGDSADARTRAMAQLRVG